MAAPPSRVTSVDTFRVLAIVAVVVIHAMPFTSTAHPIGADFSLGTVCNILARFAVPMFFVLSGYFWIRKIDSGASAAAVSLPMIKRLCVLFAVWSVIYLLASDLALLFNQGVQAYLRQVYWNVRSSFSNPLLLLMQGTSSHLWFLSTLAVCVAISALLIHAGHLGLLTLLASGLFVFAVLGKAYAATPFGFHIAANLRNGPFFGLLFFATGIWLAKRELPRYRLAIGLALAAGGALLQFAELAYLHSSWQVTLDQDFVFSTYPFGIGVAMIALSNSPALAVPSLAPLGTRVLGIYASHLLFVNLVMPVLRMADGGLVAGSVAVLAVLALAAATATILSMFRPTRRLVS